MVSCPKGMCSSGAASLVYLWFHRGSRKFWGLPLLAATPKVKKIYNHAMWIPESEGKLGRVSERAMREKEGGYRIHKWNEITAAQCLLCRALTVRGYRSTHPSPLGCCDRQIHSSRHQTLHGSRSQGLECLLRCCPRSRSHGYECFYQVY